MRIVVVISDTFRFDHVGAHGLKAIHTPHLDALARRGADFQRCYAGSFPTAPNRADVYLGRFCFADRGWSPMPLDQDPLAARVGRAGYVTQWIGDNPHLMSNNAFYHRGFTAAMQVRGQEGDVYFTRLNKPDPMVMPESKTRHHGRGRFGINCPVNLHEWINEPRCEADRFCRRTSDLACRWIEENYKADKWMLWLEFFDVHEPWDVPEYFWRRYDGDYRGEIDMRHPNYGPASAYTPAELRSLAAHYAGEVTLMDKCLGRVLRQLEDCGIDDDTAVVFTTDHGICLGEHDRTGKSNIHATDPRAWLMFEEIAHIPLIVYLPGMKPRRPRQFVQPVDLTATLMDLAGAPADAGLHGRSMMDLVLGRRASWHRDCAISAEHFGRMKPKPSGLPMLYAGKWAYGPRDERMRTAGVLYDMAADPHQTRNVVRKHPDVAARLRRKAEGVLAGIGCPAEHVEALMGRTPG